jgi:16S rRNA (uracil1498-N3)-methyltransferase
MKKIHRFISEFRKEEEELVVETVAITRQIQTVLKLSPGEHIAILDGEGSVFEIELTAVKPEVRGKLVRTGDREKEISVSLVMYVAVLKGDLFELIVQKMTEIGVTDIIPLLTDRTIKLGIKHERLISIARESTELAGRSVPPHIHEPMTFDQALKERAKDAEHVFFDMAGNDISLVSLEKNTHRSGWIGPEGGWSEREQKQAVEAGFTQASLTQTTLRGETAAILASYALLPR